MKRNFVYKPTLKPKDGHFRERINIYAVLLDASLSLKETHNERVFMIFHIRFISRAFLYVCRLINSEKLLILAGRLHCARPVFI